MYVPALTPALRKQHEQYLKNRRRIDAGALSLRFRGEQETRANLGRIAETKRALADAFEIVFTGLLAEPKPPRRVLGEHAITHIQRVVAQFYNISVKDLLRRGRKNAHERQVSMYLCRKLTHRSYPDIGNRHGGRDHTTTLHAYDTVSWLIGQADGRLPKHLCKREYIIDEVLVGEIECLKGLLADLQA